MLLHGALQQQNILLLLPVWALAEDTQTLLPCHVLPLIYICFPWQELTQVKIPYSQLIKNPALSNVLVHLQSVLSTTSKLATALHLCFTFTAQLYS